MQQRSSNAYNRQTTCWDNFFFTHYVIFNASLTQWMTSPVMACRKVLLRILHGPRPPDKKETYVSINVELLLSGISFLLH